MDELIKESVKEIMARKQSKNISTSEWIMIASAFEKSTVLLFREGDRTPSIILKIAGAKRGKAALDLEYDALLYMESLQLDKFGTAKPLGRLEFDGRTVTLQEALPGNLLLGSISYFSRRPSKKHFRAVRDAQVEISTKTRSLTHRGDVRCAQHGDFWIGNIMLDRNRMIALDLEFFKREATPLSDVCHFALYYVRVLDNIGAVQLSRSGAEANKRRIEVGIDDFNKLISKRGPFFSQFKFLLNGVVDALELEKSLATEYTYHYFAQDRGISDIEIKDVENLFY